MLDTRATARSTERSRFSFVGHNVVFTERANSIIPRTFLRVIRVDPHVKPPPPPPPSRASSRNVTAGLARRACTTGQFSSGRISFNRDSARSRELIGGKIHFIALIVGHGKRAEGTVEHGECDARKCESKNTSWITADEHRRRD